MNKFVLIKGGKFAGHGGGGSGGRGSGGGPSGPRRPHWLADLLFAAISRTHEEMWGYERAHGTREIAARMTILSTMYLGRYLIVDEPMVHRALNVVRSNPLSYGWSVDHVQKGAMGEDRGYFPVLVDLDEDGALLQYLDEDDHDYAKFGAISFARTIASMIYNQRRATTLHASVDPRFQQFTDSCEDTLQAALTLVNAAASIP